MVSQDRLSLVARDAASPWTAFLDHVDGVPRYLGPLARCAETSRRPRRALIVDIPIEIDDGRIAHFEDYRVHHNLSRCPYAPRPLSWPAGASSPRASSAALTLEPA